MNASTLTLKNVAGLALAGCLGWGAAGTGCAAVQDNGAGAGGDGAQGHTGGRSGTAATGGSPVGQGSGGEGVLTADAGETVVCDGGEACTCPPFKLAVIGKPGKW